jgi:osmoprotectant transport system permease protein
MNLFGDAIAWLADASHWQGSGGIPVRIGQHLLLTALALVVAAVIALPSGALLGRTRYGGAVIGAVAGSARALSTIGVLTLVGLWLGIGIGPPLVALLVLAVPSLLAGAYSGIQSVPGETTSAARAIGMSGAQVIWRVELPLALPVIVGGTRAAALQVVATATLAAYTANVGLGRYLFTGLKTQDYGQMLAGSILVILLALALELIFATLQRLATRHASPALPSKRTSS